MRSLFCGLYRCFHTNVLPIALAMLIASAPSLALANPHGGIVAAGAAKIQSAGGTVTINQSTNRAIINWKGFSIDAGEAVNFNLPNGSSAILNRVTGADPSVIAGQLNSNGQVFLVNPHGVLFANGAQINVGGLTASTLDISNQQFMQGGDLRFEGDSTAGVINRGVINADGNVNLIGSFVENHGIINAPFGNVNLAAGQSVLLSGDGSNLVVEATANGVDNHIINTGTINAVQAQLIANGGNAYGLAINTKGTIRALGAVKKNGRVLLVANGGAIQAGGDIIAKNADGAGGNITVDAGIGGVADITARIDVASDGGRGGNVDILGDYVNLLENSVIDASGLTGGGQVRVGGGLHGKDPNISNAIATTVEQGAIINANSAPSGQGGQVIVWGTDAVGFHGDINTLGGDNGFVEVSTKGVGQIDGVALTGHMLVDPGDVCVTTGGGTSDCPPGATHLAASTITDVLNLGGVFELNTDLSGTSGTGRVDFGGGGNFTVNNNSGTVGTFRIHSADTINTNQVGFLSNGSDGTNYEFFAGSSQTASPIVTADVIMGGQPFNTGGGHVIFNAADDVSINDPLRTSGGNVTLIARGEASVSQIKIGDFGNTSDDSITTTDGFGNAGAVTIKTDNLVLSSTDDPVIDANGVGGLVTIAPFTSGRTINVGTNSAASLSLTNADINKIAAETIQIGDENSGDLNVTAALTPAQVDELRLVSGEVITIGGAITTGNRDLSLFADDLDINKNLNAGSGTILIGRSILGLIRLNDGFNIPTELHLRADELDRITSRDLVIGHPDPTESNTTGVLGHVDKENGIDRLQLNGKNVVFVKGNTIVPSIEINSSRDISFSDNRSAASSLTTTVGDITLNADSDSSGRGVLQEFALYHNFNVRSAGNILIKGEESDFGDLIRFNANNGAGDVTFQRTQSGSIIVGDNPLLGRHLTISDATLGNINAATVNFGNPDLANNLTTRINVVSATLNETVNFNARNGRTVSFSGANSFGATTINGGVTSVASNASINVTGLLQANTPTVNLNGNITASGGISGLATTVNVQGSAGGAEIQDGVDIALAGARINVAAGSYTGFTINKANLTLDGVGVNTIINTASPAITVAANGTTVQDMLLQNMGVPGVDDVGILLDGVAAPGLTGVEIVNVDFLNLNDGVRSQGDIGDGIATNTDVTIRGNSSTDQAIFEDLVDAAIDVGDTNGDAVYSIQDVIVRDSTADFGSFATGGDAIRFGAIGGATVNRVDISRATGSGVAFGALNGSNVTVSNSSIIGGLGGAQNASGLDFSFIDNGAQINISGNSRIEGLGQLHGIAFNQAPTGATTKIDINNNTLIQSRVNQGIAFARGAQDVTVVIRGNGTNATNGIIGPGDAIAVNNAILTDVNFLVGGDTAADGNFISSSNQGLDIEGVSGGRFVVANNSRISGSTGIEFEDKDIVGGAEIIIVNNSDFSTPGFGIDFQGNIGGNSNVTITGNDFGNTANDAIRFASGKTIDAGTITIGRANVTVDGNAVTGGINQLTGSGNGSGISVFSAVGGSTNFIIGDNVIGSSMARVGQFGIQFRGGVLDAATVSIEAENNVHSTNFAVLIDKLQSTSALAITGGSYNGTNGALRVNNSGVTGVGGQLNIGDALFTGGAGSDVIEVLTDSGNAGIAIDFTGAAVIDGGATGLRLSGPGIDVLNDTLGSIAFTNQSANYIRLANEAEFLPGSPTLIDANNVTFDGLTGSAMTPAQLIATERKIFHFPDFDELGLIDISPLFVVEGESIQTAVNAAGLLAGPQTINVARGAFGGSVEVWVDNLTLQGQGAGTIINTAAVDPNANNGPANNGFQVAAISTLSGGGDVSGVIIDGFGFSHLGSPIVGIGVELGDNAVNSTAIDATIRDNTFSDLNRGVFSKLSSGDTTIADNTMAIISGNGISFADEVASGESILIMGNNAATQSDTLLFAGDINSASVTIRGNTFESTNGDAILFNGNIANSTVSIGGSLASDANDLVGGNDGIDIDLIDSGTFTISGNTRIAGNNAFLGDGLEFDNGIRNDAVVIISNNTEITGVALGVSLLTPIQSGAEVRILQNGRITGVEDGLGFGDINGSNVTIAGNTAIVGDDFSGIGFFGDVTNSSTVAIAGNMEIRGGDVGIEVQGEINDSEFTIAGNGGPAVDTGIFGDTRDGILFSAPAINSMITIGSADVLVNGVSTPFGGNERIIGIDDGINIDVISGGVVTVSDNVLVQGTTTGSGLEFDGRIDNGAMVSVTRNTEIRGAEFGVEFDAIVQNNAMVNIAENQEIIGGFEGIALIAPIQLGANLSILDNDRIVGGDDAIGFDDVDAATVTIANNKEIIGNTFSGVFFDGDVNNSASVAIAGNSLIRGVDVGIEVQGEINDSEFSIAGNGGTAVDTGIFGDTRDGILLASPVTNSMITIGSADVLVNGVSTLFGRNTRIIGVDDGINIDSISGGAVTVSDNVLIQGTTTGSGLEFDDPITNGALIIVNGNIEIRGAEQGVEFDDIVRDGSIVRITQNDELAGTESGVNVTSLNGSEFTIADNRLISGATQGGILFRDAVTNGSTLSILNNTRIDGGSASGLQFDGGIVNSEIVIAGNEEISASVDGIGFLAGVTGSNVSIHGMGQRVVAGRRAIDLRGVNGGSVVSIESGSYAGAGGALLVNNTAIMGQAGRVMIGVAEFVGGPRSNVIEVRTNAVGAPLNIDFAGAATIAGGTDGIRLSGSGVSIVGNTLGNIAFTGQSANFIELTDRALFDPGAPTIIDATGVDFDGINISTFSGRDAARQRIIDYYDDQTLGLIFVGGFPPELGDAESPSFDFATGYQFRSQSVYDRFGRYRFWPESLHWLLGYPFYGGQLTIVPEEDREQLGPELTGGSSGGTFGSTAP